MQSFRKFLTEAKFSPSNIEKVIQLMKKLIEKRLNVKTFRYGGKTGTVQLKTSAGPITGYLFFTNTLRAFQINVKRGEIFSVSVWKKYKHGAQADYGIMLSGLNIVHVMGKVIDLIKVPKPGDYPIYFAAESKIPDGEELLTEARRVTADEFYTMAQNSLPGINYEKMTYDMINKVAADNDVQVPGYIKNQRTGRGLMSVVPPSDPAALAKANGIKPEPVLFIKVTPQDPITKKFLPAGETKAAQDAYAKIQAALAGEPTQTELKDPNTLFGHLVDLVTLVIRKANKSLLITGGAGTGKSHTITNTIKEAGLVQNQDWYHIKGKVTPAALYQTLFMHRKDKLVVFDDADSVFGTEDAVNILKAALDSYDERIISWVSGRTIPVSTLDSEERKRIEDSVDSAIKSGDASVKFPSEFKYDGRIIFISNLSKDKMDSAILSRSFNINMDLTDKQMFERMEGILDKLGDPEVGIDKKKEILTVLKKRNALGKLARPNMRTFVAAVSIAKSGLPNWEDLLDYT